MARVLAALKEEGLSEWKKKSEDKKEMKHAKFLTWHYESCEHQKMQDLHWCARKSCYTECAPNLCKFLDDFERFCVLKHSKTDWPTPAAIEAVSATYSGPLSFSTFSSSYTIGMEMHASVDDNDKGMMWFFQMNTRTKRKRWFWKLLSVDAVRQWPVTSFVPLPCPIEDVSNPAAVRWFCPLDPATTEYKHLEEVFLTTGPRTMRLLGNCKVREIQRIHNPVLAQHFTLQFLHDCSRAISPAVVLGYHGTGRATVKWTTVAEGINPVCAASVGSTFGKGSYIALCPATAHGYASKETPAIWDAPTFYTLLGLISLPLLLLPNLCLCAVVYCLPGNVQFAKTPALPDSFCALLSGCPILVFNEKQRMLPRYAITYSM